MATEIGTAYLNVTGDFSSLHKSIAAAIPGITSKTGKLGKAAAVGLAGIGVAAAGAGKALFEIGEEFDTAYDKIRVNTGATQKQMEKLKVSFREVVRAVPADFADASTAIAGLNQRLDITGKPLERLSKRLLELSRITETDVESNVTSVTRAFGDWEVKTRDQANTLDFFFRASQASGAAVSELTELVVKFGAPLRRFGFDVEEATSMFALFEKAGVNIQTMVPGLKLALGNFLEAGRDPEKALAKTFAGIEDGSIKASEALKIFGTRAGSDMVEAVEQGRFKFEEFTKTIADGDDTIMRAGRSTMDFSEQWLKFKNNVMLALEPVAERVFKNVGEAMKDVTKIISDPDLEGGEKFDALLKLLTDAINDALPKIAEAGKKIAGALFQGLVDAPIWAKLLAGGWLVSKLGGMGGGAIGNIGTKLGTRFGMSFGGAAGPIAAAEIAAVLAGMEVGKNLDVGQTEVTSMLSEELDITLRKAKKVEEFMRTHPGLSAIEAFGQMTDATQASTKRMRFLIETLRGSVGSNLREISRVTDQNMRLIKGSLGEHSRRGKELLTANFHAAIQAIKRSMAQGKIATDEGLSAIDRILKQQLSRYGITASDDVFSHWEDWKPQQKPKGKQRGGTITAGAPVGDSVPAMLERGEYVLNRKAVSMLGQNQLDAINFGIAKRFAGGGIVELLGPHNDPAHGGLNQHLHIAMLQGIEALGHKLQQMGWLVSEHPSFGGVGDMHAQGGYHYTADAIDVNWPDAGAEYAKIMALLPMLDRLAGGKGGVALGGGPPIKLPRFASEIPMHKGAAEGLNRVAAGMEKVAQKAVSRREGAEPGVNVDASGPLQGIAQQMIAQRWGAGQWAPFNELVQRESGWNPAAVNPSSGAAGLAQALPPSKYPPGAWPYTGKDSAIKQLQWMISYIAGRYGNPSSAIAFHDANNWYQRGGMLAKGGVPGGSPIAAAFIKRQARVTGLLNKIRGLRGKTPILDEQILTAETLASFATSEAGSDLGPGEKQSLIGLNTNLLGNLLARATKISEVLPLVDKGKAKTLGTELADLQGITGQAGRVLDVKQVLADLQGQSMTTELDSMLAELYKEQRDTAYAQLALQTAQFPVFKKIPFTGSYEQGTGPAGLPRDGLYYGHRGEVVYPNEGNPALAPEVRVFIGDRELTDIVRVEMRERERKAVRATRGPTVGRRTG